VLGHNYEQGLGSNKKGYEEQSTRLTSHKSITSNTPIGGEHGYNNYNLISHQQNSYQNYPPTNKYPPKQSGSDHKAQLYNEKNDPTSFYKPSSNQNQIEYDTAL
jgi:hypothetical protein